MLALLMRQTVAKIRVENIALQFLFHNVLVVLERPISHEEKLKKVLLQWGSDVDDVVFMLKKKHSSSRQNHVCSDCT